MKSYLAALGWAVLFALVGAAIFTGAGYALLGPQKMLPSVLRFLAGTGAAEAMLPWSFCLCFGALPGIFARPRPPGPPDLADAFGTLLGAALLMAAAGVLPMLFPINHALFLGLQSGRLHMPDLQSPLSLQTVVIAGELTVALWLSWKLHRFGDANCEDGSGRGLAWRPAPWRAYGLAIVLSLILLACVALLFRFLPPDTAKLQSMQAAKLLEGPGWALAGILLTMFILAPFVEEILFRGIVFAGLAGRCSPVWAALISSLIFAGVHAPEKIHYPPGFIQVGLLALAACWLRLRCRSIRPGILLHILYNSGLLLTTPFLH